MGDDENERNQKQSEVTAMEQLRQPFTAKEAKKARKQEITTSEDYINTLNTIYSLIETKAKKGENHIYVKCFSTNESQEDIYYPKINVKHKTTATMCYIKDTLIDEGYHVKDNWARQCPLIETRLEEREVKEKKFFFKTALKKVLVEVEYEVSQPLAYWMEIRW